MSNTEYELSMSLIAGHQAKAVEYLARASKTRNRSEGLILLEAADAELEAAQRLSDGMRDANLKACSDDASIQAGSGR